MMQYDVVVGGRKMESDDVDTAMTRVFCACVRDGVMVL